MNKKDFRVITVSKEKLLWFLFIAVIVIATLFSSRPAVQTVFNAYASGTAQNRKLPIYSVDVPDKRISISFDAAWGA